MNQRDPEYDRFGPWVIEISDDGAGIDVESVRLLVRDATRLPEATDMEVEPPNLADFDSLLQHPDMESLCDDTTDNQGQTENNSIIGDVEATNDRQHQRCRVQVDRQFGSRLWPQREILIAREDHQANLLPLGNDLIVGLKLELQGVKLTRYKGFTFRQGLVILGIGPATGNDVIGNF